MPGPQATTDAAPIHIRALAGANGWREEIIGTSVEGVPIRAWHPPGTVDRIVFGAIHGEEAPTLMLLQTLLRTVRAEDSSAIVVPVLNPDGVLHGTRQNARGVDLNRNWPASTWIPDTQPTYWPTAQTRTSEFRTQYSSPGAEPGSEPEVAAMMELVRTVQPRMVVDLHAPLECVIAQTASVLSFAEHLAEPSSLRVVRQLETPTYGDAGTWLEEQGIGSVTYEIEMGPFPRLWARHNPGLARALVAPVPT